MLRITIPGKPVPKKCIKRGKYGNAYNPNLSHMNATKLLIKTLYKGTLMEGAVKLTVNYFMTIPESYSIKKKRELLGKPHTKRPDSDNLTKLLKDCMSGIVYNDDSQVADEHYKKIYSDDPRTEITITELIKDIK